MSSVKEISLIRKTIRFELTDQASILAGYGTPYSMADSEDKIKAQKGVSDVEVQRWGNPFVIDVTIDSELAADNNWTVEEVQNNVRDILNDHCADLSRLNKFARLNGRYPDERLVFSGEDCVVLQDRSDNTFTVCYENEGEIVRAKVENDDVLVEIMQEIIEETAHDPTFVPRGDTRVEDWLSRQKRGLTIRT